MALRGRFWFPGDARAAALALRPRRAHAVGSLGCRRIWRSRPHAGVVRSPASRTAPLASSARRTLSGPSVSAARG